MKDKKEDEPIVEPSKMRREILKMDIRRSEGVSCTQGSLNYSTTTGLSIDALSWSHYCPD